MRDFRRASSSPIDFSKVLKDTYVYKCFAGSGPSSDKECRLFPLSIENHFYITFREEHQVSRNLMFRVCPDAIEVNGKTLIDFIGIRLQFLGSNCYKYKYLT